jgi:hypothetical protein
MYIYNISNQRVNQFSYLLNQYSKSRQYSIVVYIVQDATLQSLFFWKVIYMFRMVPHPLLGAQTTVSTTSGICHTVTATCCYRGRVGNGLSVLCYVVGGVRHLQHLIQDTSRQQQG